VNTSDIGDCWRIVDSWFHEEHRLSRAKSSRPVDDIQPDDRTTQDEELAVAAGLPSQTQVIELLGDEFARAGYEIEGVVIDTHARPPRITVIADGDTAPDLETITALSRSASTLLDAADSIQGHYVLEVSSPGVQRPLTSQKHFRRARGRKVELEMTDGSQLTGRVGEVCGGALTLVMRDDAARDWTLRMVPLDTIVKAVVVVEFSPPAKQELELATLGRVTETEAGT
jgi:ribosome maturation factor RimP